MNTALTSQQLEILTAYAHGASGTRATIERLAFHDYGDLIIALARHDLPLPRPAESAARDANIARATELLLPLLKRHDT